MKEEMFQELLESIREAGSILRKEKEPSRCSSMKNSISRKFVKDTTPIKDPRMEGLDR